MNFILIAKAFPAIIFVSPFVTQAFKMAFDPLIKDKQSHDNILRLSTCIVAGIIGALSLYALGLQPHSLTDWIITVATCIAYAAVGGAGSMAAYSFLNGYLRQTPPVKSTPKAAAVVTNGTSESKTDRQPY